MKVTAERLRSSRMAHSFTQAEMAKALGVSARTIANFEGGSSVINVDELAKWARRTNRTIPWMFGEGEL